MKVKLLIFTLLSITFLSCNTKAELLENTKPENNVKFYFLSSDIMGPNIKKDKTNFQKKNSSFLIDNKIAIEILKQKWKYNSIEEFNEFTADYYLTYSENGIYRGKISIDLQNQIAISGYGPTKFDSKSLESIQEYIKPLKTKFLEFTDLKEARTFYDKIKDKDWLLPSPNDMEYYKWLEFDGETIIQVNNQKFARDKDINKAFKQAAEGSMKGILEYTEDPIVSRDVIGNSHSAIFDAQLTAVLGDKNKLIKVIAWYDNEMGYSNRLVELVELFV